MSRPPKAKASPFVNDARKRWSRAEWIIGNGPYASVSSCGDETVMLFATEAEALTAKSFIDKSGCGGCCRRAHSVVKLGA
jgi:hypothetical protein